MVGRAAKIQARVLERKLPSDRNRECQRPVRKWRSALARSNRVAGQARGSRTALPIFVPLTKTKPDNLNWTVGSIVLPCVIVRGGTIISDNGLPKFCFDPNTAFLRYTRGRGWDETTYNKLSFFQGRYVGHEVNVTQAGKKYLKIHVQEWDTLTAVQDCDFPSTPDSIGPVGDGLEVPSSVMGEYIIPKFPTPFPNFGGKRGEEVKLEIEIGRNGRVTAAKVTSGPKSVEKSAIAAAKQMEFRPFSVLGAPVSVKTSWGFSIAP